MRALKQDKYNEAIEHSGELKKSLKALEQSLKTKLVVSKKTKAKPSMTQRMERCFIVFILHRVLQLSAKKIADRLQVAEFKITKAGIYRMYEEAVHYMEDDRVYAMYERYFKEMKTYKEPSLIERFLAIPPDGPPTTVIAYRKHLREQPLSDVEKQELLYLTELREKGATFKELCEYISKQDQHTHVTYILWRVR